MMKRFTLKMIATGFCSLAAMSCFTANAQKLSDVQEASVLAPEKVKIDGKPTEWNNTFQAFNKATLVYYTMANDSKNLYLTVQASDKTIINKIMRGGITLSLNLEGKKKENDGPSITFPVVAAADLRNMMQTMMRPPGAQVTQGGNVRVEMGPGDMDKMFKRADSVMQEANKKQIAALKEIKVLRVKGMTDSLISIYNEYGIKAMASFDPKGVFTYELALPLESLGLSADSHEFSYNLKLNGIQTPNMRMSVGGPEGGAPVGGGGGGGERIVVMGSGGGGGMPRGMADMMTLLSPTFFWGKYTLAKK